MSVEKLSNDSQSRRQQVPFTQIPNNVIEHIKDNDAFRLYSYLCSKDSNWKVIKEWTAKTCGVGERKAKQCWSYLARCGLIRYVEVRDELGRIIKHDIDVLIGYQFNKDEPFINKKQKLNTTSAETAPMEKLSTLHRCKNPPGGVSTRVGFAPLLNKDITNKEKETKERESPRPKRAPLPESFFPDELRLEHAKQVSIKVNLSVEQLITKFINLHKSKGSDSADWQATFENYLITERPSHGAPKKINTPFQKNEAISTIKEWGPGHPSWDSMHSV